MKTAYLGVNVIHPNFFIISVKLINIIHPYSENLV